LNITEVRVKLLEDRSDRLRAFCSITIDDEFVVHDLRVIEGRKGHFVAMPSRKLSDSCHACGGKNHLRAKYCSECGKDLDENRARGRSKFHVDVAHPINTRCRELIQAKVLEIYLEEVELKGKGGAPRYSYERDDKEVAPDVNVSAEQVVREDEIEEESAFEAEEVPEESEDEPVKAEETDEEHILSEPWPTEQEEPGSEETEGEERPSGFGHGLF